MENEEKSAATGSDVGCGIPNPGEALSPISGETIRPAISTAEKVMAVTKPMRSPRTTSPPAAEARPHRVSGTGAT